MNFNTLQKDDTLLKQHISNIENAFSSRSSIKECYKKPKKSSAAPPKGTQDLFEDNPMLLYAMGKLIFKGVAATKWLREMEFGDFRVDFAIASEDESEIALIEFEPAEPAMIFKKKSGKTNKDSYEWSNGLEHGCGQLYDWMYYASDSGHTDDFRSLFKTPKPKFYYVLVLGWKKDVPASMESRLRWRKDAMKVDSNTISIYCYDELVEQIKKTLLY